MKRNRVRTIGTLALVGLVAGGVFITAGPSGSLSEATGPPSERSSNGSHTAIFAGGCFWCMEPPFDRVDGVSETISGYTGGRIENPAYREVASGGTGHAEAVKVVYDPRAVSYERLLEVFWHNVDPLDGGGQFCDRGEQYRAEIFVIDGQQRQLAEESREQVAKRFNESLVTRITEASAFYPAEEYHQNFYQKNSRHYQRYRAGCGRDARLQELWGAAAGH